jgi:TM2 domain-containing membrane protein YozV
MSDIEYPPRRVNTSHVPTVSRSGAMPHPLDAEWHVNVDEEVYGPFTGHDLKGMVAEGRLEYDGLVQRVGGPERWVQAADDRALAKLFSPSPNPQMLKELSVSAGDGAQIVTVNNNIAVPLAYLGEKPVDKSPFLAAVLSLLIVGVGQMYNGQVGKGFLMMFGCILLWGAMLGWIVNIWAIVDAYSVAGRKHDAYERWMEANAAAARANASS